MLIYDKSGLLPVLFLLWSLVSIYRYHMTDHMTDLHLHCGHSYDMHHMTGHTSIAIASLLITRLKAMTYIT